MEQNSIEHRYKELQAYIDKKNVTAFTGRFGIGKTTFIKKFVQDTEDKNIFIEFNANEFDYSENPKQVFINDLIRSIWAISTQSDKAKIILRDVFVKAKNIIMNKVKQEVDWTNDSDFDEYISQSQIFSNKIQELRNLITNLASEVEQGKNIVLVIDDLDRARPDFSIEVFEILKHLFDVENISIIIVYNAESMQKIAEAKYGTLAGEPYFMKYIDNEYIHYEFSVDNMIETFKTEEEYDWLNNMDIYMDSFRHFLHIYNPTIRQFEKKLKSKRIKEIINKFVAPSRHPNNPYKNIYLRILFGGILFIYLFDAESLEYSEKNDFDGNQEYIYSKKMNEIFHFAKEYEITSVSSEFANNMLEQFKEMIENNGYKIIELIKSFRY